MDSRFDRWFAERMDYVPDAQPAEKGQSQTESSAAPTTGASLPGGGGVFLLTDEQDRIVQLSAAADLRHALKVRLTEAGPQDDPDARRAGRRRPRLGEIVRRIRWRPAHSAFELTWLYYGIARELMPEDYLSSVAFGPCWFVHVNPEATIPRFTASRVLKADGGVELGPFAVQSDAVRFIQTLEDLFDLCRYHEILEQTPYGQPCAYFEMGKCPAPCNATISMTQYRAMIADALRFAIGNRTELLERIESEMREAARGLAFERANLLKQQLERARVVEHESFRFVRSIERFNYLIVQRGPGTTRVQPFLVRSGMITGGEPVRLKALDAVVPVWLAALRESPPPAQGAAAGERSEQIWLVSHFLFKSNAPGLFIPGEDAADPVVVAERIRQAFRPSAARRPDEPLGQ